MSALTVFWRFLLLGLVSFGGPTAHLGYFRETFVQRLRWMEERSYANTIALCQFLPGPGSSQVGFAIGLHRAGLLGGIAAFMGFTLPSFLVMLGLGVLDQSVTETAWFRGCVEGLKLLAVAVVSHAVLGMAQQFWRGWLAPLLGLLTAATLLTVPGIWSQIMVLLAAAAAGGLLLKKSLLPDERPDQEARVEQKEPDARSEQESHELRHSDSDDDTEGAATKKDGPLWPLVGFALLLLGLPLVASGSSLLSLFTSMVRVGSLVFGGGHVVLPLLQAALESVGEDQFLIGYAAAQGVPGPMFSLATYLGAVGHAEAPVLGALVATVGIFLPGFLLVLGLKGRWLRLARSPRLAGSFAGINAAVVGLLLAALVHPVWSSSVRSLTDFSLALAGFVLLRFAKVGVVWLVLGALLLGLARSYSG